MAQLSDDCFAFGGPMMSVDDAVAMIASRVHAVQEVEAVSLAGLDGRVLAEAVVASMPLPPFTNSAVDGYAVRSEDLSLAGKQAFPIVGRIAAGAVAKEPIKPAQAVRIFTGAPMPAGADTVFMQEDVKVEDGRVFLPAGLKAGANVRLTGEDISAGASALPSGTRLRPQDVALIAALGLTKVSVRRRIRVAVFSTGNELVAPGAERVPSQLFDSNRYMLIAMLGRLGCEVSDLGILPDDRASLAQALRKASADHDLILTSGGVSTGEEDHVKAAVESVGSLVLWRIAIKPGRPVAMGVIEGTPFIGLPGNPVASFVTFTYVVRPTVLALLGAPQEHPIPNPLRAAFAYKKKISRREYVRVSVRRASDGMLEAVKFPREGAGLLSSLVETDGFVELSEDITQVKPGDLVNFLSYASLA
ncbi:gephyrin-like molybdotransferase Glp [Bradyrhizobium sp. SYSU BS000235]|uniref:molybdopterin molybdotransferase MoeA n=1 Tax=Bradyrhizobium sp. SYSU BS000235 TaxID=3411332 RepID=UPI003C71B3B5